MRAIFCVLKDAWSMAKDEKKLRRAAIVLWIFCLLDYIVRMLQPLLQSSLLNGIDKILSGENGFRMMLLAGAGMLASGVYLNFSSMKQRPICSEASSELKIKIWQRIYTKLCRVYYSTFDSPALYEKIELVSGNYPDFCVNLLFGRMLSALVGTVISFVFTSIVLCSVHPWIAVIMIAGNLFGIFKTWLEAHLNYYDIVGNMKDRRYADTYRSVLFDRNTIKEVRLFGLTEYLREKWLYYTRKVNRKTAGKQGLFLLLDFATYAVSNAFMVAALILTSKMILDGSVGIGTFLLVYSSSGSLIDTSGNLFSSFRDLKLAEKYYEAHEELMALPEVEPLPYPTAALDEPLNIRLDHVSFRYEGSERNAVDDLCLEIKQGEKLAIVGENGSGKSTLMSLIIRLYAPEHGEIYVNGRPQQEEIGRLRREVSMVFQDFGRYETTFRNNIAMGDIYGSYSSDELMECADRAGIGTRIRAEALGLDTPIGRFDENGIELSGGEWQKLSMARALIRRGTKMLIMDEPNAALDPISEREIYRQVFDSMADNESLLLITHRLGAVKYVDRIVVMERGHVIEEGTHEELMKKHGTYERMYAAQAEWYEEK